MRFNYKVYGLTATVLIPIAAGALCPTGPNYVDCMRNEAAQRQQEQEQEQRQQNLQRQQELQRQQALQRQQQAERLQPQPQQIARQTNPYRPPANHIDLNGSTAGPGAQQYRPPASGIQGSSPERGASGTNIFTPRPVASVSPETQQAVGEGMSSAGPTIFTPRAPAAASLQVAPKHVARSVMPLHPSRSTRGRNYAYRGQYFQPFLAPPYAWPAGYAYSPYGPGMFVPAVFIATQQYMLFDYIDFQVAPPPQGFQWIRLGPDLLLVNLSTGQISEAVPGMFVEATDAEAAQYSSSGDQNDN